MVERAVDTPGLPPLQTSYDSDEIDGIEAAKRDHAVVATPVWRIECPACHASFITRLDDEAAL